MSVHEYLTTKGRTGFVCPGAGCPVCAAQERERVLREALGIWPSLGRRICNYILSNTTDSIGRALVQRVAGAEQSALGALATPAQAQGQPCPEGPDAGQVTP